MHSIRKMLFQLDCFFGVFFLLLSVQGHILGGNCCQATAKDLRKVALPVQPCEVIFFFLSALPMLCIDVKFSF